MGARTRSLVCPKVRSGESEGLDIRWMGFVFGGSGTRARMNPSPCRTNYVTGMLKSCHHGIEKKLARAPVLIACA